MAVCAHFRKWIEKSELDYNVIFKKAACTQPGDLTGIYVLSELRNFLQFNPATEVTSSGAERNHLVRLIKSDQDLGLDEEDSKLRCGLKEMIEKEEHRVWRNMMQSTTDSIDRSETQAYEKLERAKEELSHAEEESAKATAKKENAVEIRDDLADAFNVEGPQTRDSIAMSRVNKMIEKLEVCLQDALEAVGHSCSKVAAAQWEVKKIDQMARVRRNLEDEDGSLIIST
ncbi:hypothetical protein NW752_001705 [Fusarium irregulare]|uniref:Uncharacterized protein n=1 Tax=Fusarium irregulare TaxID=2494466 RepID=A0A9W8PVB3_9HYPO|nr:hypothetical protein NW766_003868 [Fusarium irregulare]KAJ4026751.1 hypothetical protein NW752_001705 [Fusarium irregulare]